MSDTYEASPDSGTEPAELLPEEERQSVWSWPDATPGQRAAAYVLDTLIVGAACGILQMFTVRVLEMGLPGSFTAIISIFYFVVTQRKDGQTLGKKAVGIRIMALEPERAEQGLPFVRLILRETVWKALSLLILGLGFARIIFRADRAGLHDTLSRSRVVSLNDGRSVPVKLSHVLSGLAIVATLTFGLGYFVKNFTAYPLRQIAKSFEVLGYRVGRVEGSLANGFSIESVSIDNDDYNFEIKGIQFHFAQGSRDGKKQFIVKDLSVQSARVTFHKMPEFAGRSRRSERRETEGPFGSEGSRSKLPRSPGLVLIESIDINDVEISIPSRPKYSLRRLFLSGLDLNEDVGTLSLSRLWVESEPLLVDVRDIMIQKRTLSVLKPAYVLLRPALAPELIKAPVDIKFEGLYSDRKLSRLSVNAFNEKLKVNWSGESGEITIADLTLLHYFKTELPFWKLDLRLSGDYRTLTTTLARGSLGMRHVRFELDNGGFVLSRDGKTYRLRPRPEADWKATFAGLEPGLTLGSSDKETAEAILAELYFRKPASALTDAERDLVNRDRRFLADSPDAGRMPVFERRPTSSEKRRLKR